MKTNWCRILVFLLGAATSRTGFAQGTFQNLDFENGTFVPIQGNPYFVEPGPALPGWTAYVGTNLAQQVLHNTVALSTAGIAIYGPDQPPGEFHGHYYIVLQAGDDPFGGITPTRVNSAITQTGTIPSDAQSIRLYLPSGALLVSFAGQQIPLVNLGTGAGTSVNYDIVGADVSAFAGQTGLLELRGGGYLDFIQFSDQPIPEPSTVGLFAFGALLLGWRFMRKT